MQRSFARSPTKPKVETWPGPAPLAVFLRNLKLLRLDSRSDWPDITLETLSGSQNNLRRRIQAVEWSLYHLFLIWDKNEAHNKLQPFFPPLEPLQSVNLRAALFRTLSDLKKNGALGREVIIRKTMLDDCKGERFEEILAAFSTAVLRKCLVSAQPQSAAIDLATAQQLTAAEQGNILPLVLAHRSSLTAVINERKSLSTFYEGLNRHLLAKAVELSARSGASQPPAHDADRLKHIRYSITSSWYGNEEWAKAVLDSGLQVELDPLLELEFSRLRTLAKKNALETVRSQRSSDLLADLDKRVAQQKSRLQKWREFRQSLTEEKTETDSAESKNQKRTLVFRCHQALTVASLAQLGQLTPKECAPISEYQSLLTEFSESLSSVKGSGPKPQKWRQRISSPIPKEEFVEMVQEPEDPCSSTYDSSMQMVTKNYEDINPGPRFPSNNAPRTTLNRATNLVTNSSTTIQSVPKISHEIQGTGPSRQHSANHISEPERPPSPDLLERTRQSMSFLPARESRPRQSLAPPKRARHSQSFSVNQFETPSKTRQKDTQRPRATTPKDELFNEDAEYASVFKSRPKIATSPVNSPAVHVPIFMDGAQDGVSDLEYDEGDSCIDLAAEGSPSVRRRTMYM